MKKVIITLIPICLVSLLFFVSDTSTNSKRTKNQKWTPEILEDQADSLLKLNKEEMALELYFKSANLSKPISTLHYPTLKKIAEVYLRKRRYQEAIYFLREYIWEADGQIQFNKGTLNEIRGEYWGFSEKDAKALEKEVELVSHQLKELEEKHLGSKN